MLSLLKPKQFKNHFKEKSKLLEKANPYTEPSEHYIERIEALDSIVRECINLSQKYSNKRPPNGQVYYASVIFTALLTRCSSLLILAPHSPWAVRIIEHWDYASIASLSRTILELRLAFFYLCSQKCSDEEWQCRWNIFNLHDCNSRKKLSLDTNSNILRRNSVKESEGFSEREHYFEEQLTELRNRLINNSFFITLSEKQQKKFLKGQDAYLYSLEDLAEKVKIPRTEFRMLYKTFSSHIHGLPMSFYNISAEPNNELGKGVGSSQEEEYVSLCLSLVVKLMVDTREEIKELYSLFE
jgi:Family of unknown function (DUF5677)